MVPISLVANIAAAVQYTDAAGVAILYGICSIEINVQSCFISSYYVLVCFQLRRMVLEREPD